MPWDNVIAHSIIATAAAYLIYFRLFTQAGATNASLVTLIVPASAILFGTLLLGKSLNPLQMADLTLLLLGLVILAGRLLKYARLPA